MKKLFFLFLAVTSMSALQAQTPTTDAQPDPNAPVFKFDSENFDFGTIPQGTPAPHIFTFTNVGKSPLIISDCQGSCHCTKPEWSTEPVMPGKTGTIKATYNADLVGAFTKTVTIHSNATEPSKVITIHGTVEAKSIDQTTPDQQPNILKTNDSTNPK